MNNKDKYYAAYQDADAKHSNKKSKLSDDNYDDYKDDLSEDNLEDDFDDEFDDDDFDDEFSGDFEEELDENLDEDFDEDNAPKAKKKLVAKAYSNNSGPQVLTKNASGDLEPWDALEQGITLWEDFSARDKEKIVRHYAPKVRFIASRMKAKLPKHIELSELVSAGTLGLLEALGKFKAQFAIRFDSYASSRIRGAMIDELRRLDWFPRSLRAKVREINQAIWRIESEFGRTPTVEELVEATGLSEKDINTGLEALQNQLCVSLDSIQDYIANESGTNDLEDPFKNTAFVELIDKVSDVIDVLTPREKLVLSLYYTEELNMREASEVMDITEGRVSQLHTQAIARIRRVFEDQFQDSM